MIEMRALPKKLVYLVGALSLTLAACGGVTQDPQPYSALCQAATDEVSIPDTSLLAAVRAELGIPTGAITCEDMEGLTRLHAENADIGSLAGLQYATNLADLNLSGNSITSLAPLAALTSLRGLNVNVNPITSLEPLRNLTNLVDLHLCCNPNDITDITPLHGLTKLQRLNLGSFGLGDEVMWPLLARYPDLEGLWIGGNDLRDFGQLMNYPNARFLALDGSIMPDLTVLAHLSNLIWLELHNSVLGDLTPLQSMTTLEVLNLSGTGISDLGFLTPLTNLNRLQVRDNPIRDLAPLVANSGLGGGDTIDLRWTPLDFDNAAVASDYATLQSRGANITYEAGNRFQHVPYPAPSPLTTLEGVYPAAANLYSALANSRMTTLVEGGARYTMTQPLMPFQVDADGSFSVVLDPDPVTYPAGTFAGTCDFSGLTSVAMMPFFTSEVETGMVSAPPLAYEFVTELPSDWQYYFYAPSDTELQCETRVVQATTGASFIFAYDLELQQGWNSIVRYWSRLSSGQAYHSMRTGTLSVEGVLTLQEP